MKNTAIPQVDLKELRKDLGLTQRQFCEKYHLSLEALREWEQGRRIPHDSAKILLFLVSKIPKEIEKILSDM